jgi:ELWxxDGT repeat protein
MADDGVNGVSLWMSDGTSDGPVMVKAMAVSGTLSSALLGDTIFFVTYTSGENGYRLWKSDGTEAGTVMVKHIDQTNGATRELVPFQSQMYFTARPSAEEFELWKTDGTEAGTVLVKNGSRWINDLTVVGDKLFFVSQDPTYGKEVWKSDGTVNGTVMVKDIQSGINTSNPWELTAVGNTLYFTAIDASGRELWKSDGTAAGTVMVKDILAGANADGPHSLMEFNSKLYFAINDGVSGSELWTSDGTPGGTVMVKDINPGSRSSIYYDGNLRGVQLGGAFYFAPVVDAYGGELWKSDGTTAGTMMVKNIRTGEIPANIDFITAAGSTVFFAAEDGIHGRQLWKSDGTLNGTVMVKDWSSTGGYVDYYGGMAAMGHSIFVAVYNSGLWKSDGTEAGTVLLSNAVLPMHLITVGSRVFFTGKSYNSSTGLWHDELWTTDGTSIGTVRVRDITASGASDPHDLRAVGSLLVFAARDSQGGSSTYGWRSDGTFGGTYRISIWPSVFLGSIGSTIILGVTDATHGKELWRSDGTAAGTTLIKDIVPGIDGIITDEDYPMFAVMNSVMYLALDDGVHGAELWRTDGTEAGTYLVKNIMGLDPDVPTIDAPSAMFNEYNIAAANGLLFFDATCCGFNYGHELWKSDGTEQGTVLLKDINVNPGYSSSDVREPTAAGGTVFFSADDGVHGRELWKSDGTEGGTVLVADLQAGAGSSGPNYLTLAETKLFFLADNGVNGRELWCFDVSSETRLFSLSLSSGALSPAFDRFTGVYTAPSVNYLVTSATVTPVAEDLSATIEVRVNGSAFTQVSSGNVSPALALRPGSNLIEVRVTGSDSFARTYTISILRTASAIGTTPAGSTDFALNQGDTGSKTITLSNTGNVTLDYTISKVGGASWLSVTPNSGALAAGANRTLTLQANATGLAPGVYTETVRITGVNADSSPTDRTVQLTVSPSPGSIGTTPSGPYNISLYQGLSGSSSFTLNNTGLGHLNYTIAKVGGASWLAVTPASGTVNPGASQVISLHLDASGLSLGTYTETISISDPGANNSPQNRVVNLTVLDTPPPTISAPAEMTFTEGQYRSYEIQASHAQGLTPQTLTLSTSISPQPGFAVTPSGANLVGTFGWNPPSGSAGTYVVAFNSTLGIRSATRSVLVYVASPGEPVDQSGVPVSQATWTPPVETPPSFDPDQGEVTFDVSSQSGIEYEVWFSEDPVGPNMVWHELVLTPDADGRVVVPEPTVDRFFQVVVEGQTPKLNANIVGVIKPTIGPGFTPMSPPLDSDRAFNGAFGAQLADGLTPGAGPSDSGDRVHLMENGSFSKILLLKNVNGTLTWVDHTSTTDSASPYVLEPGEGFLLERRTAGTVSPALVGTVGNTGLDSVPLNTGFNLVTVSEGKPIPVTTAFETANPDASYDASLADEVFIQITNPDGSTSWKRLIRIPKTGGGEMWLDTQTGLEASLTLQPGQAYYYKRKGDPTSLGF